MLNNCCEGTQLNIKTAQSIVATDRMWGDSVLFCNLFVCAKVRELLKLNYACQSHHKNSRDFVLMGQGVQHQKDRSAPNADHMKVVLSRHL